MAHWIKCKNIVFIWNMALVYNGQADESKATLALNIHWAYSIQVTLWTFLRYAFWYSKHVWKWKFTMSHTCKVFNSGGVAAQIIALSAPRSRTPRLQYRPKQTSLWSTTGFLLRYFSPSVLISFYFIPANINSACTNVFLFLILFLKKN